LTEVISNEEIKDTVWDYDGHKSSSPDGYNFYFLKNNWNILYQDFTRVLKCFLCLGKGPKATNASFMCVIPKIDNPQKLEY